MDHTVVYFEIPATDVEKLTKFYTNLFGWKIEKSSVHLEYWTIETVPVDAKMTPLRPGVNGGMYQKEDQGSKPVNYISVEFIDDYINKIIELGGKIIQPKTEVTNVGWVALALDPEGNQIAMLQPIQT